MAYRSAEDQNLGEVCNPTMKATLSNRLDSVFVSAHVILQPLRGTPHVMQLEEAMLFGKQGGKPDTQPAAKRRRGAASVGSEPKVAADEAAWAALARVYMQLGEFHLAHVTSSAHLARCAAVLSPTSHAAQHPWVYADTGNTGEKGQDTAGRTLPRP